MVEKLSTRAAELTRQEWRDLGFFYASDRERKEWRLVGSMAGLNGFADLLEEYAADETNDRPSKHHHVGPHMYLELMTWPEAGMDDHSIHGPLRDLRRLANLVRKSIGQVLPPHTIRIREEYSPTAAYALVLDVRDDSFDPASADPQLAG